MKKFLCAALFSFIVTLAFAQQKPVVAVAPFDAISGITPADANIITRVFYNRLGNTNVITLVDRSVVERVIREHQFQLGDWSNKQKTAELGEALNADWIVRGEIERFGSSIIVTVSFYDIRTFQFKGGADIPLANVNEAYDKITPLVDSLVQTIGGYNNVINTVRSILEKGISYYQNYEYDRAIFEFTDAIKLDTNLAEAYNFRGHSYYMKYYIGEYTGSASRAAARDASIQDFTKAISLDPYNAEYYFNRAVVYRDNNFYEEAIEDLNHAISLDPYNAMYYTERGNLYGYYDQIDRAIADYSRAIRLEPNYVHAYYWRAMAYQQKGDYDRSIADCNQIINLYPYDYNKNIFGSSGIFHPHSYLYGDPEVYMGNAYYSRGYAWKQKGNTAQANADYAMATELGFFDK